MSHPTQQRADVFDGLASDVVPASGVWPRRAAARSPRASSASQGPPASATSGWAARLSDRLRSGGATSPGSGDT